MNTRFKIGDIVMYDTSVYWNTISVFEKSEIISETKRLFILKNGEKVLKRTGCLRNSYKQIQLFNMKIWVENKLKMKKAVMINEINRHFEHYIHLLNFEDLEKLHAQIKVKIEKESK